MIIRTFIGLFGFDLVWTGVFDYMSIKFTIGAFIMIGVMLSFPIEYKLKI